MKWLLDNKRLNIFELEKKVLKVPKCPISFASWIDLALEGALVIFCIVSRILV